MSSLKLMWIGGIVDCCQYLIIIAIPVGAGTSDKCPSFSMCIIIMYVCDMFRSSSTVGFPLSPENMHGAAEGYWAVPEKNMLWVYYTTHHTRDLISAPFHSPLPNITSWHFMLQLILCMNITWKYFEVSTVRGKFLTNPTTLHGCRCSTWPHTVYCFAPSDYSVLWFLSVLCLFIYFYAGQNSNARCIDQTWLSWSVVHSGFLPCRERKRMWGTERWKEIYGMLLR